MKMNLYISLIVFLVTLCPLYSQQDMLNNSIVLEEFVVLPLIVPKEINEAKVLVDIDNNIDTIGVIFDSLHRVVSIENKEFNCTISYEDNSITKKYSSPFPNYFFPSCSEIVSRYDLNENGYIVKSTDSCDVNSNSTNDNTNYSYHVYNYMLSNNNNLVKSVLTEPAYELEYDYHLINYDGVINMTKFSYATNKHRLVYSINRIKGKYSFNLKNKYTRERINCVYYEYNINNDFDGVFQTVLHDTRGKRIGKLSVIR